jgi:hypothetical protein
VHNIYFHALIFELWEYFPNRTAIVLPAKIEISIPVESRPEFTFHWNSNRNDKTGLTSGIDQNGIW